MDYSRLKDPLVVISSVTLLLVIGLLVTRQAPPDTASLKETLNETNARLSALETALKNHENYAPGSPDTSVPSSAPNASEFDAAISMAKSHIAEGKYASAYDLILVASRLAPSDKSVLDLVIDFADKTASSDDETLILADDLLSRAESLIHFQSPNDVASARQRFNAAVGKAARTPAKQESPLAELDELLSVAEDTTHPIQVRSRSVEQARLALDDLAQAIAMGPSTDDAQKEDVEKLGLRLEQAEKACVSALFTKSSERAKKWLSDSNALLKESESTKHENVPEVSRRMGEMSEKGMALAQEVIPYAKSEVSGAPELLREIERQVKLIQRTKTWVYNQQVIRLIRDIETKTAWTAEDKIRHLAQVSEELLSPYVLRRHNELWEKVFEELKDEDMKVWAVRLRILQVKE